MLGAGWRYRKVRVVVFVWEEDMLLGWSGAGRKRLEPSRSTQAKSFRRCANQTPLNRLSSVHSACDLRLKQFVLIVHRCQFLRAPYRSALTTNCLGRKGARVAKRSLLL